jgi:hypothetical protein
MKIVKDVLEDELKKAVLAGKDCEKTLAGMPRGVLVKKYVKGRQYCYLLSRENGKVRFEYKGKLMGKDVQYYETVKKERALYRNKLFQVRKRIAFLEKVLRGKELRAL